MSMGDIRGGGCDKERGLTSMGGGDKERGVTHQWVTSQRGVEQRSQELKLELAILDL